MDLDSKTKGETERIKQSLPIHYATLTLAVLAQKRQSAKRDGKTEKRDG